MRLITHNMLKSNIKGVVNGFPLRIEADKVEVKETEFNAGMLTWHGAEAGDCTYIGGFDGKRGMPVDDVCML